MDYIKDSQTTEERYARPKSFGEKIKGYIRDLHIPVSFLAVGGLVIAYGVERGNLAEQKREIESIIPQVINKAAGLDGVLDNSEKAEMLGELGIPMVFQEGDRIEFSAKANGARAYTKTGNEGFVSRETLEEYLKK